MLTDMISNDFVSIFVHRSTFKKNTINGRLQKLKPLKKEALGMWDNEGEPHRTFGQWLWAAPVGTVLWETFCLVRVVRLIATVSWYRAYFDNNGAWNTLDSVLIWQNFGICTVRAFVKWHSIVMLQYRANVSLQSLEARTSRLDPRSSILEAFEYRGSSRVHRVSSRALRVSRQETKNFSRD